MLIKNSLNIIIWIGLSLLAAVWVNKKTDWFKPATDKAMNPVTATVQQPAASGNLPYQPAYAPGNVNNAYNQGYAYNGGNGNVRGNGNGNANAYGNGNARTSGNMNFGFNGGGNASGYGNGSGNSYGRGYGNN